MPACLPAIHLRNTFVGWSVVVGGGGGVCLSCRYEDTKVRLLAKQKLVDTSISSKKEKSNAAGAVLDEVKRKQERMKGEIERFNEERVKIAARVETANEEIAKVTAEVDELQALLKIGPGETPEQKKELKVRGKKQ